MSMAPQTPMGKRRIALGFSALEFARLLQAQIPEMTEGRLFRIETGRLKARPEEKEIIARLLGCRTWELDCEVNQ